jgi:hypothetical protein
LERIKLAKYAKEQRSTAKLCAAFDNETNVQLVGSNYNYQIY